MDAGGSKTHALIAYEQGQALGLGVGGAGNPQSAGFERQKKVFKDVTHQALTMAPGCASRTSARLDLAWQATTGLRSCRLIPGRLRLPALIAPLKLSTTRSLVSWSARELGESASAVIRQLNLQAEEVEIIEAGSLFKGGRLYTKPLMQTIYATAPRAKFIRLNVPPVIGGVVLAMQQLNVDSRSIREHLNESTKALIHHLGA